MCEKILTLPSIYVGMDTTDEFLAKMANEGWLVAASSYRRNGYVVKDAIDDIQDLYAFIAKEVGVPKKSILVGTSMGGAIGTVMAENKNMPYAGYLLLCPDCCNSEYDSIKITNAPERPILLVPNKDESGPPRRYAQDAQTIRPYVWIVNRDGHCKYTYKEIEEAFRALLKYVEGGQIYDNMRFEIPEQWPKFDVKVTNDTIQCPVLKVSIKDSSILLGLTVSEIKKLRIGKSDSLFLKTQDTTVVIIYGANIQKATPGTYLLNPNYFNGYQLRLKSDDIIKWLKVKENDMIKIWRKTKIKI